MINKIKNNSLLSSYIEETCSENGVCVTFDKSISSDSFVIIKVDKFYNDLHLKNTPASIDCLIIRECIKSGYGLTLVELKNIETGSSFEIGNMIEKFETTLNDFIKIRFKKLLDINYSEVKLFFVSKQEIHKRDLGLKMEILINKKFKFNGKKYMITPYMPSPTIKNCYT